LPAERKAELLNALLTGKVRDVTMRLVDNIVRNPRTRSLEEELDAMAARAAQRRERWIAHVSTAVALTDEQARRLGENLGRIYDHPVQLHVELTPELLGGLRVRVRDEVIDASVASQLEQARRRFGA
jgi:F-type H+-transporting ATPase subunit delta